MRVGDAWNAMGDPTRRAILKLLREGDMNAGEIAAHFDMSKPSISHHLNILRQAGLVRSQKAGQNVVYSLSTSVLEDLMELIQGLTKKGESE